MNCNDYLEKVLTTYKLSNVQEFLDHTKKCGRLVKSRLKKHYSTKLYNIMESGSLAKHTAISIKFDLDLIAPFKRSSFTTLEAMYNDVFNALNTIFVPKGCIVKKQKVSIGITFPKDHRFSQPVKIDVVPGRELNEGEYCDTHDLNLYFNDSLSNFYQKGSLQKTNIAKQIRKISGKKEERKIIRLFKIWKIRNNKPYKSFFFELATIKALQGYHGNKSSVEEMLIFVLEYLIDNIRNESFHLIDPGNSGNDLMKRYSVQERSLLKQRFTHILNGIRNKTIILLFPEQTINIYDASTPVFHMSEPSAPTTKVRFG